MMKLSNTTAQRWGKGAAQGAVPLLQSARASSQTSERSSSRGSGGRRKAARSSRKLQKVCVLNSPRSYWLHPSLFHPLSLTHVFSLPKVTDTLITLNTKGLPFALKKKTLFIDGRTGEKDVYETYAAGAYRAGSAERGAGQR